MREEISAKELWEELEMLDFSFEARECVVCGKRLQWDGQHGKYVCGPHEELEKRIR